MSRNTRTINNGGLKRIKDALAIDKLSTKVGWFESARYPDGTPVAYIATIQEFGSPRNGIPPRSFMRSTAQEQSGYWKDLFASGVRAMLAGNETPVSLMTALGLAAEGDIRVKISEITSPPLKPGTVKGRLRKLANNKKVGNLTKPLVETGIMISTIQSVVE